MQICENLNGQPVNVRPMPGAYSSLSNPKLHDLTQFGWREYVPSGEANIKTSHWTDDGRTMRQIVDAVWTQAEIDAQAADAAAAQAAEYKAANLERWILENAFILMCQQYFGTPEKRGTKELLAKAFELMDTEDEKRAMMAFGVVIGLDKELVRTAGDRWWDSCEWHDNPDAIAGARKYLGVTP